MLRHVLKIKICCCFSGDTNKPQDIKRLCKFNISLLLICYFEAILPK